MSAMYRVGTKMLIDATRPVDDANRPLRDRALPPGYGTIDLDRWLA